MLNLTAGPARAAAGERLGAGPATALSPDGGVIRPGRHCPGAVPRDWFAARTGKGRARGNRRR
ncbi:hypothetical protein GCM10020358_25890 [Amorphoplanes nipponensis]|uniref:Uncharacterized protein n=1 Tax=Actinoplanes nipponensis TaxID=135950 RepID=A0A919MPW6_9ACTN|nr:hypothetical protein Ani05nite_65650 [Actinoplanes nipponensis]